MQKVLFVGKFNSTTKDIQQYLKGYMAIQLCSDNVEVAKSMIQMYQPSAMLINLEGLDESHKAIFEFIAETYPELPVVIVGREEQYDIYGSILEGQQFTQLEQPISNEEIKNKINDVEGVKIKVEEPEVEEEEVVENHKKLILLVDDSPMTLRSMKSILEEKYRVAMATSGNQAMQLIGKECPDLIMLDYEMPVCDGKQTLEMIRTEEETANIPVVFLTGHGDAEHIKSVLDLKPSAYFLKPPMPDKILEVLEQLV